MKRTLVSILIVLVCSFLVGANFAFALDAPAPATPAPPTPEEDTCDIEGWFFGSVACGALWAINLAAEGLGYLIVGPIENLIFHPVIGYSTDEKTFNNPGVQAGWSIARDTANLFFIIILVIVALATIFELDTFSAKTIIPRLILIALLINFSLFIGLFVIRQANALGAVFIEMAANGGVSIRDGISKTVSFKAKSAEQATRGLVGQVTDSAITLTGATPKERIQDAVKKSSYTGYYVAGQDKLYLPLEFESNVKAGLNRSVGVPIAISDEACKKTEPIAGLPAAHKDKACAALTSGALTAAAADPLITPGAKRLAISIMAKFIVYPAAAFVLLAASFLMIARIVALSFLLVLAPLYFLSYLVPTQDRLQEWWTKLFKQAFFFPAFMFCLMISLRMLDVLGKLVTGDNFILSYFIGVSFLFASMIVAQQMGAAGTGTVMNYGNKLKGFAKTKGANLGWRAAGGVAGAALRSEGGAATLGRIPLLNRGAEALAGKAKELADKREKDRVARVGRAADIGGAIAGDMWDRSKDKKEAIDKLRPSQLREVLKGRSVEKKREDYEALAGSPKEQEKFLSAISDLNEKTEVQTKSAPTGTTMARVIANMSYADVRNISVKDMQENPNLQEAITKLGAYESIIRNLGNDEEKIVELQKILLNKTGMTAGGITPENLADAADMNMSELVSRLNANPETRAFAELLGNPNIRNSIKHGIPTTNKGGAPIGAPPGAPPAGGAPTP